MLIGIDFGNKFIRIYKLVNGIPQVVYNNLSGRRIHNLITYFNNERIIGDDVYQRFNKLGLSTFCHNKRALFLEEKFNVNDDIADIDQLKTSPLMKYDIKVHLLVSILNYIHSLVTNDDNREKVSAIFNICFYHSHLSRHLITNAADISNIDSIKVVDESTSLAIEYGYYNILKDLYNNKVKLVLFLDIGEHNMNLYIVKYQNNTIEIKEKSYISGMGGSFISKHLINKITSHLKSNHVIINKNILANLYKKIDTIKSNLSINKEANLNTEIVNDVNIINVNYTFYQTDIDQYLEKYRVILSNNIGYFVNKYRINELVMVGNTSRTPYIRNLVSELYSNLKLVIDIDESIAKGNCIYAGHLQVKNKREKVDILNYTSNNIDLFYNNTKIKICERNYLFPFNKKIKINHIGNNIIKLTSRYGKSLYGLGSFKIDPRHPVSIIINLRVNESEIVEIKDIFYEKNNHKIPFLPWKGENWHLIEKYEKDLKDQISVKIEYEKLRNDVENIYYRVNNKIRNSTHPMNRELIDLFDNINNIFIENLRVSSEKLLEIQEKLIEIEKKIT